MRRDNEVQTDRRKEETIDFDALMREFESQRKERQRRGKSKRKRGGRRG